MRRNVARIDELKVICRHSIRAARCKRHKSDKAPVTQGNQAGSHHMVGLAMHTVNCAFCATEGLQPAPVSHAPSRHGRPRLHDFEVR